MPDMSGPDIGAIADGDAEATASAIFLLWSLLNAERVERVSQVTLQTITREAGDPPWRALSAQTPASIVSTFGARGGSLRIKTGTIGDAALKTLPTTPVDAIINIPAGYRAKLLAVSLYCNSEGGIYTNINTTYATIQIETSDGVWLAIPIVNDTTAVPALTGVTNALTSLGVNVIDLLCPYVEASSNGWVFSLTLDGRPSFDGLNVRFAMDNNGSGNLTGGHASNKWDYVLLWMLEKTY